MYTRDDGFLASTEDKGIRGKRYTRVCFLFDPRQLLQQQQQQQQQQLRPLWCMISWTRLFVGRALFLGCIRRIPPNSLTGGLPTSLTLRRADDGGGEGSAVVEGDRVNGKSVRDWTVKRSLYQALHMAMAEELERDPSVFIMGEDVGHYGGSYKATKDLHFRYGNFRCLDTPICENTFLGLGVGAAMHGLRPVVEGMNMGFLLLGFNQISNNAGMVRATSGGQFDIPIVIRGPGGVGKQLGPEHSQRIEAYLMCAAAAIAIAAIAAIAVAAFAIAAAAIAAIAVAIAAAAIAAAVAVAAAPIAVAAAVGIAAAAIAAAAIAAAAIAVAAIAAVPGLKIVACSTPRNARGLLKAAIREDNPVVFFEHVLTYGITEDIPLLPYTQPLDKAEIALEGKDITILCYSKLRHVALEAASFLKKLDIHPEVVDLISLKPLDMQTIKDSVKKTGKCLILDESSRTGGIGAEVFAQVVENCSEDLHLPPVRLATKDIPTPYAKALEEATIVTKEDVINAALWMVSAGKK
ncbi:hypothetical protein ACSSS7_000524 [Eimeria intestinalis]